MKNIMVVLFIISFFAGCAGPHFGSQKQYMENDGDFYFLANHKETARYIQDKMAIEKLKASVVNTKEINNTQGYEGVVANFSNYRVNTIITGPETRGYVLEPGQQITEYLIPGVYRARSYRYGQKLGHSSSFSVGVQKHNFQGAQYHWYTYYE